MITKYKIYLISLLTSVACLLPVHAFAQTPASEIAVVVMHGKGGSPNKFVDVLAQALEKEGFQVANLEMPWSHHRQYDVDMQGAVTEISAALNSMRAKGAKKFFVAGHSQGGLNALYYGSQQTVDGLIAIAPGGNHGARDFGTALGGHVSKAKDMVEQGRGGEKDTFADYEGSKGTYPITTTAANYFDWFNPSGPHNMWDVVKNVQTGIPVLYVAPTRDYPALKKQKQSNFNALPSHEFKRLYEPDSDHLNAPSASAPEIIRWINEVAG